MSPDPFDLLRDQLVEAAAPRTATAGRRRRRWARRRGLLVLLAALAVSGTATAAVLSLGDGHGPAPLRVTYPGDHGPAAGRYRIAVEPDLRPGSAGWCVTADYRHGIQPVGRSGSCFTAAATGAPVLGGMAMSVEGRNLFLLILDPRVAAVRLLDGRRVVPHAVSQLPNGWRMALTFPPVRFDHGRALQRLASDFTLLDAHGRRIAQQAPDGLLGLAERGVQPLPVRTVSATHPPAAPCAITADAVPGLRPLTQTIVRGPLAQPIATSGGALRTCSYLDLAFAHRHLHAGLLIDARGPAHPPAALPGAIAVAGRPGTVAAAGGITARRSGPGWLAVTGGTAALRARLLAALHARSPTG
jgi:hypothetical protein